MNSKGNRTSSLAKATYIVLKRKGDVDLLRRSDLFKAMMLDVLVSTSDEARVFFRNCDTGLLTPFADATKGEVSVLALQEAAVKAYYILSRDRMLDKRMSELLSLQLAEGISKYLGLTFQAEGGLRGAENSYEPDISINSLKDLARGVWSWIKKAVLRLVYNVIRGLSSVIKTKGVKTVVSLVAGVAVVIALFPFVFTLIGISKFSDVTTRTSHVDDIAWLASSGISKGWEMDGGAVEFRPYANVTRADMAAFLFRLAESWGLVDKTWQPTTLQSNVFSDVTEKTPHAREICWLANVGISNGTKVGSGFEFWPSKQIIRSDTAAFLFRLAQLGGRGGADEEWVATEQQKMAFKDVSSQTVHADAIWWLYSVKISEGWVVDGGLEFRPSSSVTRSDMAAFLHRLDKLK